jgi:hypothetical protein
MAQSLMRFDEERHIAYIGDLYKIEWYVNEKGESPSLYYFENEMPNTHKGKLFQLFKVMGEIGKIHDKTKFRNESDDIYAFKPQPYRFLSFFTKGKRIIVTGAFHKKGDKLPKSEKNLALKAKADYETSVKEGEYYGKKN